MEKIIFALVFLLVFGIFLLNQTKKNEFGWLLNQSKTAYVLMNYSGCNKTGLVVLCASEISRALAEKNITVKPYVFESDCTNPQQKKKTIEECEKELIGLGFVVGCGERKEIVDENRIVYIGGEKELRSCTIANRIALS